MTPTRCEGATPKAHLFVFADTPSHEASWAESAASSSPEGYLPSRDQGVIQGLPNATETTSTGTPKQTYKCPFLSFTSQTSLLV